MAISVTSVGTNGNKTGATLAVTVGAAGVPAGSLIAVAITEFTTTGTQGTISDNKSNVYTFIAAGTLNNNPGGGLGAIYYVKNSIALVNGDIITYTKHSSGVVCAMSVVYAAGIDVTSPLDIAVTTIATGFNATPSVTSGTPSVAGELFLGAVMTGGSTIFSQGASFSTPFNQATSGASAVDRQVDGGNLVSAGTSTKTYAPTFDVSHTFVIFILGFKPVVSEDRTSARSPLFRRGSRSYWPGKS